MQATSRFAYCCLFLLLFAGPGCRRSDLLEMDLRKRETGQREALEAIQRLESRNDALWREIQALRQGNPIPPEVAAQSFGLTKITLSRGTGGYDQDTLPGDESLQVIVEPRDAQDHVIKAPGTIQIVVMEMNGAGLKFPLSSWEYMPEQVQGQWKQGLLSTGYSFILPWKVPPRFETVRVGVRMIMTDGRAFEVDRDVKVRLLPGAISRPDPSLMPSPAGPGGTLSPCPAPGLAPIPGPHPLMPIPGGPMFDSQVVPSARMPLPAAPVQQSNWMPMPLAGSAKLGRPEALPSSPSAPVMPGTLSEFGVWQ